MTPATERKSGRPAGELLYLLLGDPAELTEMIATLRSADIAEALRELEPEPAAKVLGAIPFDLAVQVLDTAELDRYRLEIVKRMDHDTLAPLIEAMSADQRADLFRDLSAADGDRLLDLLDPATQESLRFLLRYPTDTAGGIMTTEFVAVPETWTVDDTMTHIRRVGGAKETVYAIYVVDPDSARLVHVVSLRELMLAESGQAVANVGDRRHPVTVKPLTDREEVARIISKYNLLAVPVVDEAERLIGIVTVDDVIDALVREQTEDVQKFGGVEAIDEPYMKISFRTMVRKRGGWLTVLFLGEMLTATALGRFEADIERAVVLALFIPLIISSGGNSGGQATSLIIRAMALREVSLRDWWRVASRDLPTGFTLGAILGAIAVLRIVVWQWLGFSDYGVHYALVGATVGCAVLGVVAFGSFAGSMLPFIIRRAGLDPATASAPFVATLVDVSGIIIYFSIAALFLRGTLL